MEILAIAESYAAVLLDNGNPLCANQAETMILQLLKKEGMPLWDGMYIDEFCASNNVLLLARPKKYTGIRIADYALPFLKDYFTE